MCQICGKHVVNVNLGCPAGALPSVHLTCHSPEGMLENCKKQEKSRKHTQKISGSCEHITIFTTWSHLVVYFDYFTASTASSSPFSPWWFLRVPLSYESALVWPQASVQTSMKAEIWLEKWTELPTIRSLHQKLVSYSPFGSGKKNPTIIHLHRLTASPGFVESAVWPHQEFRDPKKGAVLPKFKRELRALFISGRPSGLGS